MPWRCDTSAAFSESPNRSQCCRKPEVLRRARKNLALFTTPSHGALTGAYWFPASLAQVEWGKRSILRYRRMVYSTLGLMRGASSVEIHRHRHSSVAGDKACCCI